MEKIFGKHDQFSGRGMEGHDHKLTIADFTGLRTQYLTKEVYNHPLYKTVRRHRTISHTVSKINEASRNGDYKVLAAFLGTDVATVKDICEKAGHSVTISYDDVYDALVLARIANDPSFAFFTTYNIRYKKGGTGSFLLNYAQRYVLSILEEMRLAGEPIRAVLAKARQWGGSTLVQLYMSWIQLFHKEQWNSIIVAQTNDTAGRIRDMYSFVLSNIPGIVFGVDSVKLRNHNNRKADQIVADQKGNALRDNVITTASYENFESVRGENLHMAHLSEFAYWRTTKNKSALQVITNLEGNIGEDAYEVEIIESTAAGASGAFYDFYQLAKQGKSNRRAIFVPFMYIENDMKKFKSPQTKRQFALWLWEHRNEDTAPDEAHEPGKFLWYIWERGGTLEHINWYISKRAAFTSHDQMASEAPVDDVECFVYSGGRIFSPYLIQMRRDAYQRIPDAIGEVVKADDGVRFVERKNGLFYVWKRPAKRLYENRYIVIVDVGGRSKTADYSVITVIDRIGRTRKGGCDEVVARWRGHVRYDQLAEIAVRIAQYYGDALIIPESNTFDKKDAEKNEYVEQGDHFRGVLTRMSEIYDNFYYRAATDAEDIRNGILVKVGFQTNVKTKQDMVDQFTVDFEDDKFIDHDERMYDEAGIYEQRPNGSYGNIEGRNNHDDIIMTCMIGSLVSSQMPLPSPVIVNTPKKQYRGTVNESYIG